MDSEHPLSGVGDPVMSRLDRALNESWPVDAATTPDRMPIPGGRVVWERVGEELLDGRALRWSGRSVFVSPIRERCKNGALGMWLEVEDIERV